MPRKHLPIKQPTLVRVELNYSFRLPTDSSSSWTLDGFVTMVRSKLNKEFWPSIEFYIESPWEDQPELVITYARPETNDERKRREWREKAQAMQVKQEADRIERQERATLKQLQDKYNK